MSAFWIALWLVFAAELGDKTQLVALAFATRYNARTVLAGVFVATLMIHLVSVGLGEAAGWFIQPSALVRLLAGLYQHGQSTHCPASPSSSLASGPSKATR